MSPTKKAVKKKDTEPKKVTKQIRFKKPYAANIPGELSDAIRGISPNNAKSYFYREGQVPGVGCPVLPNELGEGSRLKVDEDGNQETRKLLKNGNEITVTVKEKIKVWLYDALVGRGVAEPINMRSPIQAGDSMEDILLQREAESNIEQEQLDAIYRDYGARTVEERLKVVTDLLNTETLQEAEALV